MLPSASRSRKRSKRTQYNTVGNLAFSLSLRLSKPPLSSGPFFQSHSLDIFPSKTTSNKTPFPSYYSSISDLTITPLALCTVFYPSAPFHIIARETTRLPPPKMMFGFRSTPFTLRTDSTIMMMRRRALGDGTIRTVWMGRGENGRGVRIGRITFCCLWRYVLIVYCPLS